MKEEHISPTFIRYASDLLGHTNDGLGGTQIIEATTTYASEYNIDLPYLSISMAPNKRNALYDNLSAFSAPQQFRIIKELCDSPRFTVRPSSQIKELKCRLISRYGHLRSEADAASINLGLVEETKHWLEGHSAALDLYNQALEKFNHGAFSRNLLDDLRLSLEKLLHALFSNGKSLENQKSEVGRHIQGNGGSSQLANMFMTLVSYYCHYQNDYVKHNDAVKEEEIDFIIEITSSFMKHLIKISEKG
jgi:hypothetical protein